MLLSFYVFNRKGFCLYSMDNVNNVENVKSTKSLESTESTKSTKSLESTGNGKSSEDGEKAQLLFGLLYSMNEFIDKSSSENNTKLKCFRTKQYTCHVYESISGLKFVALTDPMENAFNVKHIYTEIYVPYVARNPFMPGCLERLNITNTLFHQKVAEYFNAFNSNSL